MIHYTSIKRVSCRFVLTYKNHHKTISDVSISNRHKTSFTSALRVDIPGIVQIWSRQRREILKSWLLQMWGGYSEDNICEILTNLITSYLHNFMQIISYILLRYTKIQQNGYHSVHIGLLLWNFRTQIIASLLF